MIIYIYLYFMYIALISICIVMNPAFFFLEMPWRNRWREHTTCASQALGMIILLQTVL